MKYWRSGALAGLFTLALCQAPLCQTREQASQEQRPAVQPLIQEALEIARSLQEPAERVPALIRIARLGHKAGDTVLARAALEDALAGWPEVPDAQGDTFGNQRYTYLQIVAARAAIGDVEDAVRLAKSADPEWQSAALLQIALVQSGKDSSAASQAWQMTIQSLEGEKALERSDERERVFEQLAMFNAREARFDEALKAADQIEDPYQRALALTEIASVQREDEKGHSLTLQRALDTVQTIPSPTDRAWAIRSIALEQSESGDLTSAIQTLLLIRDPDGQSFGLWEIALEQLKAGDIEGARATAQLIQDPRWKADALAEIALADSEAGNHETAEAALKHALQLAAALPVEDDSDEFRKASTLGSIAVAEAALGHMEHAIHAVELTPDSDSRSRNLRDVARQQALGGDYEGALKTAESIPEGFWRAAVLTDIAEMHTGKGDKDAAGAALNLARDFVSAGNLDEGQREYFLSEIALARTKLTSPKAALQALGDTPDLAYLGPIVVERSAQEGDWEEALQWTRIQQSPSVRLEALLKIIETLVEPEGNPDSVGRAGE